MVDIERQEETYDLVAPGQTYESVTESIGGLVLNNRISLKWLLALGFSACLLSLFVGAVTWLVLFGVGIWGVNIPVGWGFAIVNFVWWIGIGHAGTLISAILLLLHQSWRTSINRFAEAMTLFAVMCAGVFPLLHLGRHQYFYWLMPFPNTMGLWPQFRSPLVWDVFAVSTYMTVSALFWFVGLIPDLATLRDRATNPVARVIFGALALGWRGSALHWRRYMALYLILAGLSTPLVLSVHTIVSFDFAVGIVPGWHSTIFPPYFVAGAIYAGFAMVLLLAIPLRATCNLKGLITMRHLENMAKLMLATGLIVFYGYIMEVFFGWYSANPYERYMTFNNRMFGPYKWVYWALIVCNGLVPQVLWFRKMRTSIPVLFATALVVSVGMWLERFVIVVTSLARDYMPSKWGNYYPTAYDWATYIGTIGLFLVLFLLFVRVLPSISMSEMRELVHHDEHAPQEA
ncbi:MAG TPA: NrfD/PsrC family molybdoenzyme membrane anchor subunit [Armatimonadota bacterium]|jgi:molybdopterin-containing oxidoreductase family membrane subunit